MINFRMNRWLRSWSYSWSQVKLGWEYIFSKHLKGRWFSSRIIFLQGLRSSDLSLYSNYYKISQKFSKVSCANLAVIVNLFKVQMVQLTCCVGNWTFSLHQQQQRWRTWLQINIQNTQQNMSIKQSVGQVYSSLLQKDLDLLENNEL